MDQQGSYHGTVRGWNVCGCPAVGVQGESLVPGGGAGLPAASFTAGVACAQLHPLYKCPHRGFGRKHSVSG